MSCIIVFALRVRIVLILFSFDVITSGIDRYYSSMHLGILLEMSSSSLLIETSPFLLSPALDKVVDECFT